MEPSKKPTANTPALPLVTQAAQMKKRSWLTRETKLGLVVAGTFLAVAGGIMGVKSLVNSPKATSELRDYVETPPSQTVNALSTSPQRMPPTIIEAPSFVPDHHIAPPDPVILPVGNLSPMASDVVAPPVAVPPVTVAPMLIEPIVLTPIEPASVDPMTIVPAIEIPVPPAPMAKNDGFSSTLKEPRLDPLDRPPPVVDPLTPEVKNPIIRIGATEPKKDEPPPLEAPPAIEVPPLKIEVPPLKIETPPIEPLPMPKMVPMEPLIKDVPLKIEAPMIEPAMKDPPPMIEFKPKTDDVPPVIELTPKRNDPPAIEARPKTEIKKDGDFDEDLHTVKPNESYRVISKQYYNSEAYTVALQRYNRDHPGQADYVRIPPIWVLEKKYASDITATPTRAVNYNAPIADGTPRNEPVYTVGDNGEMLADIARQKLGSEEAWKRIWDLNPQVNPAKQIPGGTRLRMPAP